MNDLFFVEHEIEMPFELQTLYEIYSQQAFESESQTATDESAESEMSEPGTNLQKVSNSNSNYSDCRTDTKRNHNRNSNNPDHYHKGDIGRDCNDFRDCDVIVIVFAKVI